MKKFLTALLSIFLLTLNASLVSAIEDPFAVPNNKYGIHIIDESDLESAASLVNSNGGDWGYVTIVISQYDRDPQKWQSIFDKMADLHLIPLVRIASIPVNNTWEKLQTEEIDTWVSFLSSLSWPTKNRYVIVGNEPNHAKEWGGKVNPAEYVTFLKEFSLAAKQNSQDYFILPAGLDASAPNLLGYMNEERFLQQMMLIDPDIFDYIDGWVSHSYPNPAFSGEETDTGKGTVRTYQWEIAYLKSFGVDKDFPIFITETGWIHDMNGTVPILTDTKKVGDKLKFAFENVWTDKNIVAITPFVLNYQSFPFETFSWKDKEGNFYDFYYTVQALAKTGGNPKRNLKPTKPLKPKAPPTIQFASVFFNLDTHGDKIQLKIGVF